MIEKQRRNEIDSLKLKCMINENFGEIEKYK